MSTNKRMIEFYEGMIRMQSATVDYHLKTQKFMVRSILVSIIFLLGVILYVSTFFKS